MNKIVQVGKRNHVEIQGRRYNLSQLISESYQTLYSCELDSKIYRLTEGHIEDIKKNPEDTARLSRNLEILKGLVKLGESVKIKESDIPPAIDELEKEDDEDVINEDADMEQLDDEDVINEDADMETLEDEDVINEDADMEELEDEDVINEDADMETLDDEDVINGGEDCEDCEEEESIQEEEEILDDEEDEDPEITPEELQELKKHLKEIRKARRARESAEPDMHDPDLAEDPERMKKTGSFAEGRSWKSEKTSMTKALKNFRESSNKKAFYKSFAKLQERMKNEAPLSLDESILLYKASNSAMTHLAVELEHNPGFIYTFKECASLLAEDNNKLLECIRNQESPSKSLVESYRTFSSILLESEDFEDEIAEEDEEILLSDEEPTIEEPASEEVVVPEEPAPEDVDEIAPAIAAAGGAALGALASRVKDVGVQGNVSFKDSEEEIPEEGEEEELEEDEEDLIPSEEIPAPEEVVVPEEELEEDEEEEELDAEITDEEAEELRNKLAEMRKSKRNAK